MAGQALQLSGCISVESGRKESPSDDEGRPLRTPADFEDSEYSLLDITDLVFVDAVSTGYSRPLPGEEKSQFHGVSEDASAFAEFIRIYLTRFDRWARPSFFWVKAMEQPDQLSCRAFFRTRPMESI